MSNCEEPGNGQRRGFKGKLLRGVREGFLALAYETKHPIRHRKEERCLSKNGCDEEDFS